jgi:hypothetical protein
LLTQENIVPFDNLPGAIGIGFQSKKLQNYYLISEGKIRTIDFFSNVPPEAKINTRLNSINLILPPSSDFTYCIPYPQSPNKSLVVASILYKKLNQYNPTEFAVIDLINNKINFVSNSFLSRSIDSIAWSDDSQYFAILMHESKSTFGLMSLLSSMSGHPVRKNNYFLSVYRKTGECLFNIKIAENYIGTSGEIIWSHYCPKSIFN